MPSAEYFRRQADICVRLSVIASDQAHLHPVAGHGGGIQGQGEGPWKSLAGQLYLIGLPAPRLRASGDHGGPDFGLAVDADLAGAAVAGLCQPK